MKDRLNSFKVLVYLKYFFLTLKIELTGEINWDIKCSHCWTGHQAISHALTKCALLLSKYTQGFILLNLVYKLTFNQLSFSIIVNLLVFKQLKLKFELRVFSLEMWNLAAYLIMFSSLNLVQEV